MKLAGRTHTKFKLSFGKKKILSRSHEKFEKNNEVLEFLLSLYVIILYIVLVIAGVAVTLLYFVCVIALSVFYLFVRDKTPSHHSQTKIK